MSRAEQFHDLYGDQRIRAQLSFYRDRRDEYGRANRQAIVVRNVLLLLAAVAGALSQATPTGGIAGWAVAGAVLAALAAAVAAYAALIGFPQLEKLYGDAVRNLEEAEIDWDVARAAPDVTHELERVEGIFRSEIGQWGQLVVKDSAAPVPSPDQQPGETSEKPGGSPGV